MINQAMIEEYTENIDTSEMIIEYHRKRKTQDLENYFLKIEDWLQTDVVAQDNRPLVIDTDTGIEKKALLVKWMCYHQENSTKKYRDLIIPHFAGTGGKSSNLFYAMYKMLIGLRERFDISQKVELIEEKILMYFNYWLELCNRTITGRVVDDSIVILVFDSIDLFKDTVTGEETNVALWLAQTYPSKIRVIVTAETDSRAMKHFRKNGCKVLKVEGEPIAPKTLIKNHFSRSSLIVDEEHKARVVDILKKKPTEALNSSLFTKIYLSTLLPSANENISEIQDVNEQEFRAVFRNVDYNALSRVQTIEELNLFILESFSKSIMEFGRYKDILIALTVSEKGLSTREVLALTRISQKEWNHFVAIFDNFMMKYKDLWKISEETFRKVVIQKFIQNNSDYIIKLHSDIADVLSATSNSLRKLEEETYHLFQCKAYFRLKEAVTNIENFLLLFNPRNKYELCRYWQTLELNGFDPALEYTNAIEGFDLRYRPTPEQTFMIILQISRFLQEFGDFETRIIPDYRHPPVVGGPELKEIGLKREIKKLGMYISDELEVPDEQKEILDELENHLAKEFPEYSGIALKDLTRKIHYTSEKRKLEMQKKAQGPAPRQFALFGKPEPTEDDEDFVPEEASKTQIKINSNRRKMYAADNDQKDNGNTRKDLPILNNIESLNVDIPKHREEFKLFYVNEELEKRKKGKKQAIEVEEKNFEDESSFDEADFQSVLEQERRQKTLSKNDLDSTLPLNEKSVLNATTTEVVPSLTKVTTTTVQRTESQPTFYYYKRNRWLWMMFPWVCLSYKSNYSKIIFECFSSPTKYISVADEREKTMQALRLAIESKIKKELVYAKPGDKTQFAVLKNIKKNIPGFLPARRSIRMLPSVDREASMATLSRTNLSKNNVVFRTTTSRKSLKLGDLSPVRVEDSDKVYPQTTRPIKRKGSRLFVTGDFANGERTSRASISFALSKDQISKKMTGTKASSMNNLDEGRSFSKSKANNTTIMARTLNFADQRVQNMIRNADEAIDYMLNPNFIESVFKVSSRQAEMFETKVIQLKKDMNDIIHMNKAANEKLKHFKALEGQLDGRGANDINERMDAKADRITREITKVEEDQNEAMEQQKRLSLIIKVCQKNKSQNELWIHNLNYLVTNFKKVIVYEEKSIDKDQRKAFELQQTANKIIKEYGDMMEDHQRTVQNLKKEATKKKNVVAKIQETQEQLRRMMSESSQEESSEEEDHETTVTMTKDQIDRIREKERNDIENLEDMREQVEQIRETIGLNFNTPKFRDFVKNLEKMSDFEQAIYQSETEIEKLREKLTNQSNLLATCKKARGGELISNTVAKSAYDEIDDEDKLFAIVRDKRRQNDTMNRGINKNTKTILDAKNTLSKICKNVGLDFNSQTLKATQLPIDEIVAKLQEKVEIVRKYIPREDFEKLSKGKVDLTKYYKEHGYDFEINKDYIFDQNNKEKDVNHYRKGNELLEQKQYEMP